VQGKGSVYMSELITAANIDLVIRKNREIKDEVTAQAIKLQTNPSIMKTALTSQFALVVLQGFGLIQMPIEDKFLSGVIYVKDGKYIPVINTALPRANQYFAAWHEIYHLIFDKISFDLFIESDNTLEERKAECFAANMLLSGVERYYTELPEMEFTSKVFRCMSAFQAPYKAVLVSLYEYAVQSDNEKLGKRIKEVFDLQFEDMPEQFRMLGLDDSLVKPSYVINVAFLQEKIRKSQQENPELKFHKYNEEFLENIIKETAIIMRKDE
jgi:Zn-dependent peptidase ImmA (M78 family)